MNIVIISPDFDEKNNWKSYEDLINSINFFKVGEVPDESITGAIVDDSTNRHLHKYRNLKVIFSLSAGVDNLLSEPGLPDVPIIRLITQEMVSLMQEYIIYQVLRLHRNFPLIENLQIKKTWIWFPPQKSAKLCNVTILGLGRLGKPVAKSLFSLGFKISGWSRSKKKINGIRCVHGLKGLDIILRDTNILINLLPLTAETKGLLNKELFYKLPQGASLINVSRGGCLNESDLLEVLNVGHLKSVVLDVFSKEPLPKTSPLWIHPNISITPHLASYPEPHTFFNLIRSEIEKFINSFPSKNAINKRVGY